MGGTPNDDASGTRFAKGAPLKKYLQSHDANNKAPNKNKNNYKRTLIQGMGCFHQSR